MLLRIVDDTEFRDVPIKEGEMFLLPRKPNILPVAWRANVTLPPVSKHTTQPGAVRRYNRYRHRDATP